MSDTALYVFCIAEGAEPPAIEAEPELMSVSFLDLHAVVRSVETEQFAGLKEIQSGEVPPALSELLLRHDFTIRQTFATHELIPMRFGVAVSDEAALTGYLQRQYEAVKRLLDRLRGHAEWGIKWERPDRQPAETATAPPASGRDYLRRRQTQLQADQRRLAEYRKAVDRSHTRLSAIATAAVPGENHAERPEITCAYLVARSQEGEFLAAVADSTRELAAQEIPMHLTGPWPPYSFCGGDAAKL